jgi:hypothetical protein
MAYRARANLVFVATLLTAALGIIAALVVALADWAHGDEPVIVSLLLVGSFVSLLGAGLGAYTAGGTRSFLRWLAVALNIGAFVLLSIFWRLL